MAGIQTVFAQNVADGSIPPGKGLDVVMEGLWARYAFPESFGVNLVEAVGRFSLSSFSPSCDPRADLVKTLPSLARGRSHARAPSRKLILNIRPIDPILALEEKADRPSHLLSIQSTHVRPRLDPSGPILKIPSPSSAINRTLSCFPQPRGLESSSIALSDSELCSSSSPSLAPPSLGLQLTH
jgi:hypothetical protein